MNLAIRKDMLDLCEQSSYNCPAHVENESPSAKVGAGVHMDWLSLAPLMGACCSDLTLEQPQIGMRLGSAGGSEQTGEGAYFRKGSSGALLAGGVPALGGIFQVFQHARTLAVELDLFSEADGIEVLSSPDLRKAFSEHVVSVTSSSNIGLAVGLAARALGFVAEVHFATGTAQWKIDVLRKQGATVASHRGRFQDAVAVARAQAEADSAVYHVDDNRQLLLRSGYSAMALELQAQLTQQGVKISRDRPLDLYICKKSNSGQSPLAMDQAMRQVFEGHVQCVFDEAGQADAALGLVAGSYHGDGVPPARGDGETQRRMTRVFWDI